MGELNVFLTTVAGVLTAISIIIGFGSKLAGKWLSDALRPTNNKLDSLRNRVDDIEKKIDLVDMSARKNFLVNILDRLDKGEKLDHTTIQRFWENYDAYIKEGGNSYIKETTERLQRENKL